MFNVYTTFFTYFSFAAFSNILFERLYIRVLMHIINAQQSSLYYFTTKPIAMNIHCHAAKETDIGNENTRRNTTLHNTSACSDEWSNIFTC